MEVHAVVGAIGNINCTYKKVYDMKRWEGFVTFWLKDGRRSKREPVMFVGSTADKAIEAARKVQSKWINTYNCKVENMTCVCVHCDDRGRVEKEIKGVIEHVKCNKCKGIKIFETMDSIDNYLEYITQ